MADRILVLYGSYRSDRMGIRLASFIVAGLAARGADVELIDAKAVGLPMLDRMYKEHPKGAAPPAMEALASKIRAADAFVFVTGEYSTGMIRATISAVPKRVPVWVAKIAIFAAVIFVVTLVAVVGTQLLATLIAGFGLLMTPVGWGWVAVVWGYALVWFVVEDRVKLVTHRLLDRRMRTLVPGATSG